MLFLNRHWSLICNCSLKLEQYEVSEVNKEEKEFNPTSRSFAIVPMCKYILAHCNAFVRLSYKSMLCVYAQTPFINVINYCIV